MSEPFEEVSDEHKYKIFQIFGVDPRNPPDPHNEQQLEQKTSIPIATGTPINPNPVIPSIVHETAHLPVRSALMSKADKFAGMTGSLNFQDMPLTELWFKCRDDRGSDCYWNGKALQDIHGKPLSGEAHEPPAPGVNTIFGTLPLPNAQAGYTYQSSPQFVNTNASNFANLTSLANAGPLQCPDNYVMTHFGINPANKLMYTKCRKKINAPLGNVYKTAQSGIVASDKGEYTHQLDRFYMGCPDGMALNYVNPFYNDGTLKFEYRCI